MELQALNIERSIYPHPLRTVTSSLATTGPSSADILCANPDTDRNSDSNRLFCYALAATIGTGGLGALALQDLVRQFHATGSTYNIKYHSPSTVEEIQAVSVSDYTATIKAAFGLSISDLAAVLQVKRPTIYAWLDPDTAPETLRAVNLNRLTSLFSLATYWNNLNSLPAGEYMKSLVFNGDSLLKLFRQDDLDELRIKQALREINRHIETVSKPSLGEQLRQKGFAEVPSKFASARTKDRQRG
ncbi:MAG: hypothetical protein Q8K18_18695 [Burkholderiales bacterium]|nr:hypothetical protein [Burkholderiales bacterium]